MYTLIIGVGLQSMAKFQSRWVNPARAKHSISQADVYPPNINAGFTESSC